MSLNPTTTTSLDYLLVELSDDAAQADHAQPEEIVIPPTGSGRSVHMPARDTYHDALRNALVKDGWTITDDPFRLTWGVREFYVDLGAERVVAAEKAGKRIAVEVKSFLSMSPMHDLEVALGQFLLYRSILEEQEPDRTLFVAIPREPADILDEPVGQLLIAKHLLRAIVFDPQQEEILRWIP